MQKCVYLIRFLRRKDTGTSWLPDLLHIVPQSLLLQCLVCFAFARVVFDRLLQTACIACTGMIVNRFYLFLSLQFWDFYLLAGSVSVGQWLASTINRFYYFALVCSRASYKRILQPITPRHANSACMTRTKEAHTSNISKITSCFCKQSFQIAVIIAKKKKKQENRATTKNFLTSKIV